MGVYFFPAQSVVHDSSLSGDGTARSPLAVVGGASGSASRSFVDLRADYGVRADDPSDAVRAANTVAINKAIVDYGDGRKALLVLPTGSIYVEQDGTNNWSIQFASGTKDVTLSGQGRYATRLIQSGSGDLGDWHCISMDRTTRCAVVSMGIEQGLIANPEVGEHMHLIYVRTIGSGQNKDSLVRDVYFGKCIGDAIAIGGLAYPDTVVGLRVEDVVMRLSGTVHPSRDGARTGISFQKGYEDVLVSRFDIHGAQNSLIDMESTGAGATLSFASFQDGYLDNSNGHTSVAMTFSGVGNGTLTQHPRLRNVVIREGALSLVSTADAVIEGVTIIMESLRPNSPEHPLLKVRQVNNDLCFRDLRLYRTGSAGTGSCVDVINDGVRLSFEGTFIDQGVAGAPMTFDGTSELTIRDTDIIYRAADFASRNAILVNAVGGDSLHPTVQGLRLSSSLGPMSSAARFASRTNRTMNGIRAEDIRCAGHAAVSVEFNSGSNSVMDANPIFRGNDVGPRMLNQADNPLLTIFPLVAGDYGWGATLTGPVVPEGNVAAVAATMYMHVSSSLSGGLYFKATTSGSTGWARVA